MPPGYVGICLPVKGRRMPTYNVPVPGPDVFSALSSPVRRSLLELLGEQPQTVEELAGHFDMRRPSVSQHLRILKDSGLVREQRSGRHRVYRIDARPLREAADWLHPFERFWRERLNSLAELLDEDNA
jgi:DNA-binding transcriptional ArsR family regulator